VTQGKEPPAKKPRKGTGTTPTRKYRGMSDEPVERAAEWNAVDPLVMHRAVAACDAAGDAILFGRTRRGDALSVVVMVGSERVYYYPRDEVEAVEVLRQIIEDADASLS
jgi:hypothetical protein